MMSEARFPDLKRFRTPSWFKGKVYYQAIGCQNGYETTGWHVGVHLKDILQNMDSPYDKAKGDWQNLDFTDDIDMLLWGNKYIRYVIKHIPMIKQFRFIKGLRQAHEEGRVEL
ncbi:MAG: hypothetical protein A3J83_00375 [Elusimicrobia bacterium RIFOXYA2_FULL_40_6]|nr:MAG: hypothetical protein A3J83_00375 [Elusimicrobia bacterium RIFOXYA2_FULL_40_6]